MSLTQPTVSGAEGSGQVVKPGSAWISAKQSERSIASQAYSSDPKYKKYTQQVEKCLNSFENIHEWADTISFLKQLHKTFESYTLFKEIPRKLIVAKRLAQCLNPALPTGVHQRALAVYAHILSTLGPDGLKRDLNIWSPGLFPFFEYAATSVKPTLLNIYEAHYLPLQTALRPIMKSFILSLLPGLEEETGEFFEKVIALLDRLAGAVSMSFFFQNIWLVMLTSPASRGTALNFLSRRLPQLAADEDITSIVGQDMGLMIRAFASALEDENLLVRRSGLDILLQSIKVNGFITRKAQRADRMILMRAATGVVLRRDLSLNRRLYTWLLGSEEKSDLQIAYLRENALDLLTATLKTEMLHPSAEYSESRPFKIFISLLDKWEIGSPLTEALVYDAFQAVMHLIKRFQDVREDLSMTANTLYEAVEPRILWKYLFLAIVSDVEGDGTKAGGIQLSKFILQTFTQDDEIQTIHLPIVFSALFELVERQVRSDPSGNVQTHAFSELLSLLQIMSHHIPNAAMISRPTIPEVDSNQVAYDFARAFFQTVPTESDVPSLYTFEHKSPLSNIIRIMGSTATAILQSINNHSPRTYLLRDNLETVLATLEFLLSRLTAPLIVAWDPKLWLDSMLDLFGNPAATFVVVDRLVTLSLSLHRSQYLEPPFSIDKRDTMSALVRKLLNYLQSNYSAYHVRATSLIWELDSLSTASHVEAIVARSLTDSDEDLAEAYECFGVFWRLSDDTANPGFRFKIPLMIVLDSLKSENPKLRRVAETWMRCSLKSYIRILDPMIYDLLEGGIIRKQTAFKVRGREIHGFIYERPFDQHLLNHILEILLSVVNFGGQGFTKATRLSAIKRSTHPGLVKRVQDSGLADFDSSYLSVLVEILLRFVQSEPADKLVPSMRMTNILIQSNTIELLQLILSRGDVDNTVVESVESATIGKLYYSVHNGLLDLQNKWLHLLHSVISVSSASIEAVREKVEEQGTEGEKALETLRYSVNPLLVQSLVDGVSTPSNKPVLQHWLDFILMAVPQFQPALQVIVSPLAECLCRQVMSALEEVLELSYRTPNDKGDHKAYVTDAELIMLLNGLEKLILLSLAYTSDVETVEEETVSMEKSNSEPAGLLGYVSNVFSSDSTSTNQVEQLTSRSPGYRCLDEGIRVLYFVWVSLVWKKPSVYSPKDDSLNLMFNRTRFRCRRVLEHLFRVQSGEVFESIVDWWSRENLLSVKSPDAAFELVDVLVSNAQNAVHMICESISLRISAAGEKSKRALNPNLSDSTLFNFMEHYFRRLEGPLAVQVWARFVHLVKDIGTSSREFKVYSFSALKCLGILGEKITQTSASEDKKIRKELQDHYGKLLDVCLTYVGKSTDAGSWIRRTARDVAGNGRESPLPRSTTDEKPEGQAAPPIEPVRPAEIIPQISTFVAVSALPNLRKMLVDNDKILNACNNIVYYIVNPAMRNKTRPMDVDETVVRIIEELTHIPAALKSWRAPIADLFGDNRLFNCSTADAYRWKPIIKALHDTDKTAFPELLGKISNAPSANIFTNREYEMLLRSLNLRRLSYVLFVGEKNHWLTQLPSIQERLVDVFRSIPSPVVQSEVFLCLRVLLCRLSPHNLTSFWPVVLTEMYRIFEQAMTTPPADGSEDLQLVFAASKCLDLLLVLQTEEFQIHQWVFITDTVDAVYRPDGSFPEAMMDQMAEVVTTLPVAETSLSLSVESLSPSDERPMRKPLLGPVRQIESIRDLAPFFSGVSLASYESIYASGGNVDWESVEKSIMNDMFDGR